MVVYYLPIESYTERYTAQLRTWTEEAFNRHGLAFVTVDGQTYAADDQIENAGPLDWLKRPRYSLSQVSALLSAFQVHGVSDDDVVYFDDMFTPGLEAVSYYLDQIGRRPRLYARNWAGSCDVYDYVYKSKRWMRQYEAMVAGACRAIFCASPIHAELMDCQGFDNVEVVGLPFDADEVRSHIEGAILPLVQRPRRVLFSSRWDAEKQPQFFVELARRARREGLGWEFAVATGKKTFASNTPGLVELAREAEREGSIKIYAGLSKSDYYRLLADSCVQFNCALQDWVSFTMLEASAFETPTVAPAFRSFTDELDPKAMYVPWSIESAYRVMFSAAAGSQWDTVGRAAQRHSLTLDRVCNKIKGSVE